MDTPPKTGSESLFTWLDKILNVSEAKVSYLTKVTPIDKFLAFTFLKLIPKSVKPNHITSFRLATIPLIVILLLLGNYTLGTILFLFSAFSDALDGALARTTRQITAWGTVYDPLADKLLIGLTSLILVSQYLSVYLALSIVVIEILLVVFAYLRFKGRIVPAKTVGKIKMILQSFGLIFLLLFLVSGFTPLLAFSAYTLYLAVFFGLLSLFVYRSI